MADEITIIKDNYEHVNSDLFYIPTSIPGKGCNMDDFDSRFIMECNNCQNSNCAISSCCCIKRYGQNYVKIHDGNNKVDIFKRLVLIKYDDSRPPIFECNNNCTCSIDNCENRLLQIGPFPYLEIVLVSSSSSSRPKGYGVRTTIPILAGQFVCEYAGEIIGKEEAISRMKKNNRRGNNYIFWLTEHFRSSESDDSRMFEIAVDATVFGNIGRYINHSCEPNCKIIPVRIDSLIPKLGIFAMKMIQKGEEITYDYAGGDQIVTNSANNLPENGDDDDDAIERKFCYCDSTKCRKYLPFSRLYH